VFPGKTKVVHVAFDDPPKLAKNAKSEEEAMSDYRRVRDEIRSFIERLDDVVPKSAAPKAESISRGARR
jgi:arsenate reductase